MRQVRVAQRKGRRVVRVRVTPQRLGVGGDDEKECHFRYPDGHPIVGLQDIRELETGSDTNTDTSVVLFLTL